MEVRRWTHVQPPSPLLACSSPSPSPLQSPPSSPSCCYNCWCCYCCCYNARPILLLFLATFLAYNYLMVMMVTTSTSTTTSLSDCDMRRLRLNATLSSPSSQSPASAISAVTAVQSERVPNMTGADRLSDLTDNEDPDWDLRQSLKHSRHLNSKLRKASDPRSWRHLKGTRLEKLKLREEYLRLKNLNLKSNSIQSPALDFRDRWKLRTKLHQHQQQQQQRHRLHGIHDKATSIAANLTWLHLTNGDDKSVTERVTLNRSSAGVAAAKSNVTSRRHLPQALIIGVKKGGTRALLEFIRLHPDVRAVGPETHFFDRHYHRGLSWYRQQMPPTLDSQLTMEKTPSYFVTRDVPKRIFGMSHDIKLLVVVRDPVTRAISDYAQTVSKRRHMRSFHELAFLNNVTGMVDTSWGAIKIGVYARHLENWLQYFSLRQFHFVSGERLIKDPAGEMAKVQDFLGVRRIVTENHFYFNETKGFPCLKKSEGNGSPRCLGKTKGRTHPNVDHRTLHHLRDFFRPFNTKFYQMTGVNFGWQ